MEAVQENVQVEAVEINDPLVDVLSVEALATVILLTFSTKSRSLVARMLSSLKTNPTANVKAFNW